MWAGLWAPGGLGFPPKDTRPPSSVHFPPGSPIPLSGLSQMPSQAQLPRCSGPTGGPLSSLVLFLGLDFKISSVFPLPYFYSYQSISPCDGRRGPAGSRGGRCPGTISPSRDCPVLCPLWLASLGRWQRSQPGTLRPSAACHQAAWSVLAFLVEPSGVVLHQEAINFTRHLSAYLQCKPQLLTEPCSLELWAHCSPKFLMDFSAWAIYFD